MQAAGCCRISYPHMHCAKGAVIREEIGEEQDNPRYPSGSIDATVLIDRALQQNVKPQPRILRVMLWHWGLNCGQLFIEERPDLGGNVDPKDTCRASSFHALAVKRAISHCIMAGTFEAEHGTANGLLRLGDVQPIASKSAQGNLRCSQISLKGKVLVPYVLTERQ